MAAGRAEGSSMDVFEAIKGRRSIRRFREGKVSDEALREIIEAGIMAPSAGNLQARKFFVLRGEAKKKFEVSTGGRFQFGKEAAIIVVCADEGAIAKYGERGVELYCKLDCGAAIVSMMLAAHARGLGTCWVGSFDEGQVRQALKLPANLRPVTIVPIGVPDEKPQMPGRKSIEEACEFLD